MNDSEIRRNFHKKMLLRHHAAPQTLVLDELGLLHGAFRADIAVVNGKLIGYEIKSEEDSLDRLQNQIVAYDSVFDSIAIIITKRHRQAVTRRVPKHWGIVLSEKGKRGAVHFRIKRKFQQNPYVDPVSVARLLWKSEAIEILKEIGAPQSLLKSQRVKLYRYLSRHLHIKKLKSAVRKCLKQRSNCRKTNSGLFMSGA